MKFDGFRAQLHKINARVTLLSKNGNDFTQHYPMISAAAKMLRAREAIIDPELVACSNSGLPNFYRLLSGKVEPYELRLWALDLLQTGRRTRAASVLR